jgi:hypothetical protein
LDKLGIQQAHGIFYKLGVLGIQLGKGLLIGPQDDGLRLGLEGLLAVLDECFGAQSGSSGHSDLYLRQATLRVCNAAQAQVLLGVLHQGQRARARRGILKV